MVDDGSMESTGDNNECICVGVWIERKIRDLVDLGSISFWSIAWWALERAWEYLEL